MRKAVRVYYPNLPGSLDFSFMSQYMKIGLFDIDSKLPNLALMKISTYHKSNGDQVEITTPIFANHNKYYASKIFKFSDMPLLPKNNIIGGTGYRVESKLPAEIEACQPDYKLYPHFGTTWILN